MSDLSRRAQHAQNLLGDELFIEVLTELDNRAIEQWRSAPTALAREEAWVTQKVVGSIRKQLQVLVERWKVQAIAEAKSAERKP